MLESRPRRRAAALWVWGALGAAACTSTPQTPPPAVAAPSPPPLDASYDWHALLLIQFGTRLVDVTLPLHEVLLFRAASRAEPSDAPRPAQTDDAECYAIEQSAPRFVARIPSEYMLCFKHDRLSRVQATVNLPQSEAAQIFSDACRLWQRNGPVEPSTCAGQDGAVGYAGRLDREADQTDAVLTVTLDATVQP